MNNQQSVSTASARETKSGFFRKVNEIMRRIRRPATRSSLPSSQTQLEFPLSD